MSIADTTLALAILRESPEASIWSRESLLESASNGIALVAELDGCVTGLLIGRSAADEFEILNLAVAKQWRRRGAGTALVKASLESAGRAGANHVHLEVRASNEGGIAFYERMGFRVRGRRVKYYRDPVEDAVLLVFHNSEQRG
jgi:ribosomal-protein-alanine N-acetyltransferase